MGNVVATLCELKEDITVPKNVRLKVEKVRGLLNEETEIELSKIVNKKHWLQINEYFVRFGQLICKPINPKCEECVFQKTCKYSQNRNKNN